MKTIKMKLVFFMAIAMLSLTTFAQTTTYKPLSKSDTLNVKIATPTGLATSALQTAGNTNLSSIDAKVATSALQTVGNTSLASIDTKLTNIAASTYGAYTDKALSVTQRPEPAQFGVNGTTVTAYNSATNVVLTNAIEIIVENTGNTNTTVLYGGVSMPLEAGAQRQFKAIYDIASRKYTPYNKLTVNATATATVVVTSKFAQ